MADTGLYTDLDMDLDTGLGTDTDLDTALGTALDTSKCFFGRSAESARECGAVHFANTFPSLPLQVVDMEVSK